ncbi:hypothetical protein J2W56_001777 [Nocardia kruczakiae]|uniref:Uncharacterized protein n=1 Tax=Nocardia kruczakiae TaxID=261477 RepID=A0ABU1XBY3_9NOCA|nr:hypothetical protein [Nocardia kruczakiae]MDR7168058.1 hypothetical protein [Nocardia kruczakiae]
MATGVGLRIAEDECVAAIVTSGGETDETPEPLYIARESVLHMSDDGDTALGGEAPPGHTHSITGFVRAVGDPAGITVDDGEAYRAEDLVATAMFCLINLAAEHLNGPAEFYATHPGDWPAEHVRGLREALDYLGLRSVVLVSEADLPAAGDSRAPARDAARAALAAVLATPAGTTPPDPAGAENALVVTDVLPAVQASDATMQAYSAAVPAVEPPPAPVTPTVAVPAAEVVPPPEPVQKRRLPLLIASAAAVVGLVVGGIAVALMYRDSSPTQVPASDVSGQADARTQPVTTTIQPPPPPPPATTVEQQPQEYPETTTETTPAPPPPPTVTPTTAPPSLPTTTSRRPTTTPRTTTTAPGGLPELPLPGFQVQ